MPFQVEDEISFDYNFADWKEGLKNGYQRRISRAPLPRRYRDDRGPRKEISTPRVA